MKHVLLFIALLVVQTSWSQEQFTEADAKRLVDTFFEGFHEGDTLKMRSVMLADVPMQSVFSTNQGEEKINSSDANNFLTAIAIRGADQKWEEKLLDYKVSVDGNLAHVWTPYEFYLNGNFSHCGANAFTMAKTAEGWKIVHIIDSRRKADCRM